MEIITNPANGGIPSLRRTVFFIISGLACFFCLAFGADAFLNGFLFMGILDYTAFLTLLVVTVLAYHNPTLKFPYYSLVMLFTGFFFYYFVTGGFTGTSYLWILLVPFCAPFFIGGMEARYRPSVSYWLSPSSLPAGNIRFFRGFPTTIRQSDSDRSISYR